MVEQLGTIRAYNADCMDIMKEYPDKYFDLAVVDPPYGINASKMILGTGKKNWKKSDWDNSIPDKSYFDELFRVSKNQIIWGGITLLIIYIKVDVGYRGTREYLKECPFLILNLRGHHLIKYAEKLSVSIPAQYRTELITKRYIPHKNLLSYIDGFYPTMQKKEIKY